MPTVKKISPKKTVAVRARASTKRTPVKKIADFAPVEEFIMPSKADRRVVRLEWASVLLGIASVVVATLGYWYVFGDSMNTDSIVTVPVANDQPAVDTTPMVSQNYTIAPTVPTDTLLANVPRHVAIAVYSTIDTKGAAAALQRAFEDRKYDPITIGNKRPTQKLTTIQVKKSMEESQYFSDARDIVEKKYTIAPIGTLDETSLFDIVITIGSTLAPLVQ